MKTVFLDRYRQLGHEITGDEKPSKSLRVNTLKTNGPQLLERLQGLGASLKRIDYLRDGYLIQETPFSLGASFEYLLGHYTLQEAASQFPVETLAPQPGEAVLDMCAAPGTKTTQLAAHMENMGALVAVDIDRSRRARAERQRGLIKTAVGLLKEGGVLSYTTCSLEPEENELNVQWLLDNFDVELREIRGPGSRGLTEVFGKKLDEDIGRSMRFWPEETGTQGFYVAEAVKK